MLDEVLPGLTPDNHPIAVALAAIPEKIRGFGHVKQQHLTAAKADEASLLEQFRAGAPASSRRRSNTRSPAIIATRRCCFYAPRMTWVTRRNNRHDKSHCDKGQGDKSDGQTDNRGRRRGRGAVFASFLQARPNTTATHPGARCWKSVPARCRGIATIARSKNACPMCWPAIAARATSIPISPPRADPLHRLARRVTNGNTARPVLYLCRRAAQFGGDSVWFETYEDNNATKQCGLGTASQDGGNACRGT